MNEEKNAGKKTKPVPLPNDLANNLEEENQQQKISTEPLTENKKNQHGKDEISKQFAEKGESLKFKQEPTLILTDTTTHHSKKWKEYLFEFCMLFLAITAGFFVDNKREYYMEHQKVNQYSKQLLADLRLDSLLFENRNKDIQSLQKGYDSLIYMLTRKDNATDKQVLETLFPLSYVFDIPATTTTYNQMKGSGSLRYIENMELTAHLQDYYDVLLPRSIKIANTLLDYYSENINPYYLKHIRVQDYDSFNDTLINKNPVMLERTKQTDQELANIMGNYRALLKIQVVSMNNPALKRIKETIAILKNEYDLD